MRFRGVLVVSLAIAFPALGWAVDGGAPAASEPSVAVSLGAPAAEPVPSNPSETRLARVTGWIRGKVPECPPEVMVSAAQRFLEELQDRHPEQLDRLLSSDLPLRDHESDLFRHLCAQLAKSPSASLREDLARRRLETVLTQAADTTQNAAGLMEKIKGVSQVQYRRLLEGRLEDDELALLLKRVRQGNATSPASTAAKPEALTAAAIVSEFSRHNQVGAAAQRLRAYTVEGVLKTASGEEQHLLLFKLRPNSFRLVILVGGSTRFILTGDGQHFWQQAPGQAPQIVAPERIGQRRYLGEFLDPLFGEEGCSYERLDDGVSAGKKFHRIAVRRSDGFGYVAQIDPETFQETGREDADGSSTRYSDFRVIAGVTVAFREEATDKDGHKGVLELTRITPNPGLIQEFFEPETGGNQAYFAFERLLMRPPLAAANSKPAAK
jgi:hypothetical protein